MIKMLFSSGAPGGRTLNQWVKSCPAPRRDRSTCTDSTGQYRQNTHCTHIRGALGPRTGPRIAVSSGERRLRDVIISRRRHDVGFLRKSRWRRIRQADSGHIVSTGYQATGDDARTSRTLKLISAASFLTAAR
jgi:hypothetical protein